jgi:hypothetical protein
VYRARDVRLDRDVALKLPPDAIKDDPYLQPRFEHEAGDAGRDRARTLHGRTAAQLTTKFAGAVRV